MSRAEALMAKDTRDTSADDSARAERDAAAQMDALIQRKAVIRMLTSEEIRALPGGASDFLGQSGTSASVCYLFQGCPWDNGRGRLCREMSGGEVHGLVVKTGPVDAEELGQALKEARGLRVLILDGANLTRRTGKNY